MVPWMSDRSYYVTAYFRPRERDSIGTGDYHNSTIGNTSVFTFVCVVAKYGTPNKRIEEHFSYIPKLRELGLLHYKWTMVTVLEQETADGQGIQEDVLL